MQDAALLAFILIGLVKMAQENMGGPLGKAAFGKRMQVIQGKRFAEGCVGLFQAVLDAVHQSRPQWKSPNEVFGCHILGKPPKCQIIAIMTIDPVAMTEGFPVGIHPPGMLGAPGEFRRVALGEEEFMIAFDKPDVTPGFLLSAPG